MACVKYIYIILICLIIFTIQYCTNSLHPEEIVTDTKFQDFLTSETWYAESVIQCGTDTVTESYSAFSIKFSKPVTQSDSTTTRFNYYTTNGAPAFSNSGYLIITNNDIPNSNFSSSREDSVVVIFKNVYSNIEQSLLEFDVKEVANCDSPAVINKRLRKELRLGDIAFRCAR